MVEGFDKAKEKALEVLDDMKIPITDAEKQSILTSIASTSLSTKIHQDLAKQMTDINVDAVQVHIFL